MSLNFRTLDLNLLRVLDSVMAEGSLTRAAAALSMTQPAVSHAVRRLHEAVGEDLFVRTARGMTPTPRAEALWPQVRQALALLRQTLAPGEFDPRHDAAQLRVAMADATAVMLAPVVVRGLERDAAAVELRLLPLTTRDPRALLEADEADLVAGYFPEAVAAIVAHGTESHFRYTPLYDTRYVCVMRRDHPLAGATPVSLQAYCDAHHALVSFSGRPRGYIDQALAGLGHQRRVVLTVHQFFTAARVAATTDLLTVLPAGFVQAIGYGDRLVESELPLQLGIVHVVMLWHLRHDAAPEQVWLRTRLHEAACAPRVS